jgi:hypothetical protein
MKSLSAPLLALMLVALVGCQTLFTGAITLTATVEEAARDYARAFNQGLVPPDVATKASVAHAEFRKAAGLAADALEAYKASGTGDAKAAFAAAQTAAFHFVDVIYGLLSKHRVAELRAQIQKASAP